jgi:hypothetical protein
MDIEKYFKQLMNQKESEEKKMSKKEKYTNKRYLPIAMKYKFKQNLFIN